MGRVKDMTGMKFGRLTVIERRGSNKSGNALWLCKCDCGNEIVVRGADLRNGNTKSCGCYKNGKSSDRMRKLNKEMWQDEEFRQMQSDKTKEQWKDEEMKWKLGYKGGITPISKHLRNLNEQWFNYCKQQANYTCELTGKVGRNLHTHHLKAFSTIVLEAHKLHNIQIHEIIGEYTKEELHKLEEYVASWHKDSSNAVVLSEEVHDLFHSLYGKGNNTKEQFEEFKERYLNGEFNDLLGGDLND